MDGIKSKNILSPHWEPEETMETPQLEQIHTFHHKCSSLHGFPSHGEIITRCNKSKSPSM